MEQSSCLRLLLEGERGGAGSSGGARLRLFPQRERSSRPTPPPLVGHDVDYVQSQHYGNLPALPLCYAPPAVARAQIAKYLTLGTS